MNIFNKIVATEYADDTALGFPAHDWAHYDRRMNAMSQMTGGKGFRVPSKGPKLSRGGKTRKELIAAGIRKPRLLKVHP